MSNPNSDIFKGFLKGMSRQYVEQTAPAAIVRDFVAGMTDDYFLNQCHKKLMPEMRPTFSA